MKITADFDAGNIDVVCADAADDIQLQIRHDSQSDFFQWFYYCVEGVKDIPLTMNILNAGESSYAGGWPDYLACASYDGKQWVRVPTSYDEGCLSISHTPDKERVYYAYFPPYSFEQHNQLLLESSRSPLCALTVLGKTLEGRDLSLLTVGNPAAPLKFWIIARQHPGETMAEWFVEGMLAVLLDEKNALSAELLQDVVFYIVPNMNPDGSVLGNLRTNAAGANLNRAWQTPTLEKSPEVYCVREKMEATGVNFFLDVHGDETLPYVFVAGAEEIPSYTNEIDQYNQLFKETFLAVSDDFQVEVGYPKARFSDELLTLAVNHVVGFFQCPGYTLEMPFKDNANRPDKKLGWSIARCKQLAHASLKAMQVLSRALPRK